MRQGRILLVEDDDTLRFITQRHLKNKGYATNVASNGTEALKILGSGPADLVITDLNLPGMSGLELLKKIRVDYPDTTVIMITAYGTIPSAVEAVKCGALEYVTKPIELSDLTGLAERALARIKSIGQHRELNRAKPEKYEGIIGNSQAFLSVLREARRVAPTDATVLIQGDTGTGKEELAKFIHFHSTRREKPLVTINCGAIPAELLESELFGHVRGSFTGATAHKMGKVEMAHTGTLFLDEIGDLPFQLQVRLLRLIQNREIEKIGAPLASMVNIRIIAATNRDLQTQVNSGSFREDLFYRLSVVPIHLPPLRNRIEDIPTLVQHFLQISTKKHRKEGLEFPSSLVPFFTAYSWPGNVRQLQNTVERVVVLASGERVTLDDLPEFLHPYSRQLENSTKDNRGDELMSLGAIEKNLILHALHKANWNQSRAAKHLGITRKTLLYRIAKFGITKP